jgi:hypothetical protein
MHMLLRECTDISSTYACHTQAACKVQTCLMHAHHTHPYAHCMQLVSTWYLHCVHATHMPHANGMHMAQMLQTYCMCPTCALIQGICTSHTHHFACYTHTTCLWHSPCTHPACTHQTCHTHITNLSYAHCTCTAYLPLACHRQAEHFSDAHIHASTGILHARTPQACCTYTYTYTYIRCMHAPRKQHSSSTHATLTCIKDATYATCASMLQACQRHTVCMLHVNYMPHMHACIPHSYFIYCKHTNVMHNANMYLHCMHAHYTHTCRLLAAACLLHAEHM